MDEFEKQYAFDKKEHAVSVTVGGMFKVVSNDAKGDVEFLIVRLVHVEKFRYEIK
ncbi:MAG: hypothetical protein LEGION0403_FIIPPAGN_01207 [Legionella sp.]|uniref:hypothetical protein n=1 Tax=Legionella sp. TaxID=459 RepID=UPI003D1196E1